MRCAVQITQTSKNERCLQEVERKFGKFGEVREARIVRNPHNGESRGFGFVAMERDEDVDRVRSIVLSFRCPAVSAVPPHRKIVVKRGFLSTVFEICVVSSTIITIR